MAELLQFTEGATRSLSEFEFLQKLEDKAAKLGMGSFAQVKLAKEKTSNKLYALKIININLSKASIVDFYTLRNEVQIHKVLSHPNVIQFCGYICEPTRTFIVLEYAENGNLYNYMQKKKSLSEQEVFKFFYQACQAIQHLHKCDVIHRDIKPENLLLDKQFNLKLCDFGWSTFHIHTKRTTFCGTYEYMAPEILKKKPYDYRVDIWSLGILLYELYHREAPYKGRSLPEITASLEKNNLRFSVSIPLDMKDLIQKLLKFEPKDRLSIDDIFKHSWIERNRIKEKQLLCLSPRQKLFIRTKVRNIETPSQEFMENKENITPKYQENNKESLQVTTKKALSPLNINILEASSTFMKKNKNEVQRERSERKKLVLRELKPLQEIQLNLNIDEVFNHKPNKEVCAATPLPKYLVNGLIYKQKDSQNAYSQVKTTLRPHALSPSFAYQLNNSMENFIRPNTEQKKNKAPNLIRTLKNPRHQRVLKYNAEPAASLNQNQEQKQLNVKTIANKDNHRVRKLSKSKTPAHNLISTPLTLKFEKDQSVKRCKAFKNLANQFATEVCSAKLGTINEKITASPSTSTTVSSRSRNENTGSRSKFQTYTIEADLISSQRSQESNIKVSRFQTDGDERNLTPIPFTQFHKGNGLSRRLVKKSNQDLDAVDSQFPKEDFKIFL